MKCLSSSQGDNPVAKVPRSKRRSPPLCRNVTASGVLLSNSPAAKQPVARVKRLSLSQGNSPVAKQPAKKKRLSRIENDSRFRQKSLLECFFTPFKRKGKVYLHQLFSFVAHLA